MTVTNGRFQNRPKFVIPSATFYRKLETQAEALPYPVKIPKLIQKQKEDTNEPYIVLSKDHYVKPYSSSKGFVKK